MTFGWRLVVLALAVYASASLVSSLFVAGWFRRVRAETPTDRAGALLALRLVPTIAALATAGFSIWSFMLFEPRRYGETTGVILLLLAILGAMMLVLPLARLGVRSWLTIRIVRAWRREGEPLRLEGTPLPALAVTTPFPIVAVVGVFRPRLVVARSVLEHCTADELAVILAHESAHVRRRDNLSRALIGMSADALAWLPASRQIADRWHEAAEEAADDHAGRSRPNGRVLLAEALIRVARLAQSCAPVSFLPASALFRGERIDGRVRRLLDEPARDATLLVGRRSAAAMALVGLAGALGLHVLHEVVEAAVQFLP